NQDGGEHARAVMTGPSGYRVAVFPLARTPQCGDGPFAAAGAVCADGGGPIGWGAGGGALRAVARGAGCCGRLGAVGVAAGAVAGAGFVSGDADGSGAMMLTAGIDAAEGKSY